MTHKSSFLYYSGRHHQTSITGLKEIEYYGEVVDIAITSNYILFLTGDGRVFEDVEQVEVTNPQGKIIKVVAGDNTRHLLSDKGVIYKKKDRDEVFAHDPTINNDIIDIYSGRTHAYYLTSTGALFSKGSNPKGCCGIQKAAESGIDWREVTLPPEFYYQDRNSDTHCILKTKFKSLSCGEETTFLLLTDGRLYGVGGNHYGELGLQDTESISNFQHLPFYKDMFIVDAKLGSSHAVVLNDEGHVYTSGYNGEYCLAQGIDSSSQRNSTHIPERVTLGVGNVFFEQVFAGLYGSFFVSNAGDVYASGSNGGSEMGIDPSESSSLRVLGVATNIGEHNQGCEGLMRLRKHKHSTKIKIVQNSQLMLMLVRFNQVFLFKTASLRGFLDISIHFK